MEKKLRAVVYRVSSSSKEQFPFFFVVYLLISEIGADPISKSIDASNPVFLSSTSFWASFYFSFFISFAMVLRSYSFR